MDVNKQNIKSRHNHTSVGVGTIFFKPGEHKLRQDRSLSMLLLET